MPDWLFDETALAIVLRAYARQMLALSDIQNSPLERESNRCAGTNRPTRRAAGTRHRDKA